MTMRRSRPLLLCAAWATVVTPDSTLEPGGKGLQRGAVLGPVAPPTVGTPTLRLTGWVQGFPTTTTAAGYVLPLTLDRAMTGWVCNLDDPTTPLRLDFAVDGVAVGSANATGIFYNDRGSVPLPAPALLRATFIFYVPDRVLAGGNGSLTMTAVDPGSGRTGRFTPGAAATAGRLNVTLAPRSSPYTPTVGPKCLGSTTCLSPGDALSFNPPWFEQGPAGWTDTPLSPDNNLFNVWNCTAPGGGVDTIVRLSILPYARRPGAGPTTPGDRYHHRGFKKDSLHLSESEFSPGGGPVLHFSAARTGIPGKAGRALGLGATVASVWGLKKAEFNPAANRWEVYNQLDQPLDGYGVSSLDGVDGANMIVNDGGAIGWGPIATIDPSDPRCRIPSLSAESNMPDIPSYPLVGSGPLGLTTVQMHRPPASTAGRPRVGPSGGRCIHMNPKLSEFGADGVPAAMWAYMWSEQPAHGCTLPNGTTIDPGYYAYRILAENVSAGWQLDLAQGKAEVNQTRGQAMKKEWGPQHQTSFIYSAWDLPPLDTPPSTIFRVDTATPSPRVGQPLLQCFGPPGDKVHLGEATGNRSQLFFLVDFDSQVQSADTVGEVFSADIYYAYRSNGSPRPPQWAQPATPSL